MIYTYKVNRGTFRSRLKLPSITALVLPYIRLISCIVSLVSSFLRSSFSSAITRLSAFLLHIDQYATISTWTIYPYPPNFCRPFPVWKALQSSWLLWTTKCPSWPETTSWFGQQHIRNRLTVPILIDEMKTHNHWAWDSSNSQRVDFSLKKILHGIPSHCPSKSRNVILAFFWLLVNTSPSASVGASVR